MEVKTNEGLSSEAVISKLTDASLYTVGESLSAPRLPTLALTSPQAVTERHLVGSSASLAFVLFGFGGGGAWRSERTSLRISPHHGDRHRSHDELQIVVM